MSFYNLKADQAAFLLIDSNENCDIVASSDSFNYVFKKMRLEELNNSNEKSKEAGLFYLYYKKKTTSFRQWMNFIFVIFKILPAV